MCGGSRLTSVRVTGSGCSDWFQGHTNWLGQLVESIDQSQRFGKAFRHPRRPPTTCCTYFGRCQCSALSIRLLLRTITKRLFILLSYCITGQGTLRVSAGPRENKVLQAAGLVGPVPGSPPSNHADGSLRGGCSNPPNGKVPISAFIGCGIVSPDEQPPPAALSLALLALASKLARTSRFNPSQQIVGSEKHLDIFPLQLAATMQSRFSRASSTAVQPV